MTALTLKLLSWLLSPISALVAVFLITVNGHLRPNHFDAIEPRHSNLRLLDLFIGFWIFLAGGVLILQPALQMLGYDAPLAQGEPLDHMRAALSALIGQTSMQATVVLYVLYRVNADPRGISALGMSRPSPAALSAGAIAFLAALPIVTGTSSLMAWLSEMMELETPKVAHELLKVLLDSTQLAPRLMILLSAVVLAPLLEEIIFRGLVQSALLDLFGATKRWTTILVAAGFFSLIHVGGVTWHALPGLFFLGIILGWLYETHRSLWPCIVLHLLFNAANVALGLLQEALPKS